MNVRRGVAETRERHVLALVERIKEGLELGLVRVIADVAGIQHLHREAAPLGLVGLQLGGVELVIEDAAMAAHEVGVEVIGLEAVDDRGAFADGAVLELQNRDRGGVVFVRCEVLALGLGAEARDRVDFARHAHQEGIEGVATGGEEGAAAILLADIPAVLAIPWADTVVVVDFAVMDLADEALVDDGLGGFHLAGEAALEADAALHAVLFGGFENLDYLRHRVGHRLLENDVLFRVRGGDGSRGGAPRDFIRLLLLRERVRGVAAEQAQEVVVEELVRARCGEMVLCGFRGLGGRW